MTGDSGFDDLLREAQQRLREQQEDNVNAELGDEMTPAPEQHFMGRWRGVGKMQTTKRGLIDVFLVWDRADKPGFLYQHSRLAQEVDADPPQIGDRVLVLRGPDDSYEKDGQTFPIYPYVLRRQACDDPLPDQPAAAEIKNGDQPAADNDIPF